MLFKPSLLSTRNSLEKMTKENIDTSHIFSNMPPRSQQPHLTITTSPTPDLVKLEIEGLTRLQDEQFASQGEILPTRNQPSNLSLQEINELFAAGFSHATQADLTRMVEEWRRTQGRITLCET